MYVGSQQKWHGKRSQVGDTLGAFTVERLLGRGAYGEVEELRIQRNPDLVDAVWRFQI
jgi:hypothetical protein